MDENGTPCPNCDLPFGLPADELAPMCWYCGAGEGQASPPLPVPDAPGVPVCDHPEHLPVRDDTTFQERLGHICPACGWSPSKEPTDG